MLFPTYMIRPATKDDIELIVGLEDLLFPENCLSEKSVEVELEAGRCWVEDAGKGYVLTRKDDHFLDILRLGVHPQYQGCGFGGQLLDTVLKVADCPVMLTVKKSNRRAIRLYKKRGFEIVATLPQYDAWVMLRDVTSTST